MVAKLVLKKFDPKSKQYFTSEKRYLLKKLNKRAISNILHIGSTAVPHLGGKGIIDLYMILKSKKSIPKILNQIISDTNYINPIRGGDKERIFLWRERKIKGKKVTFHLHLSWKSAKDWRRKVLFVNYLIEHPETAKRYEELKQVWAKRVGYECGPCKRKKTRWVRHIVRKAEKEFEMAKII